MKSGAYALTASFAGASQYAPSVSPVLTEKWPSTGPGFSLLVTEATLPATAPALASLEVEIAPIGHFQQDVALSCGGGPPKGYSCSFSPEVLSISGKSILTILPPLNSAHPRSRPLVWPGVTAALLFGLLLASGMRRQPWCLVFVSAATLTAFSLSGCGSYVVSPQTPRTIVLTVQAITAGSPQTIIHSAQIPVRLAAEK
jgi:hypothetical protein